MLTTFHRFDVGLELPRRKVELYKNICKLQLEDRPRARGIKMLLPFEKSQFILQRIAIGLLKGDRLSIQQSNLLNFLGKQPVFTQEDIAPKDFLKQIETVSELLVQRDLGEYEFPHLSFQGYYAASYLEHQGDKAYAVILENWDKSDAWRETILFYTAQLTPKDFTEMLERVCKLGADSAKLAYECLRQYRNPERIDQGWNSLLKSLMGDVKALLYQNLEKYLKNQQWEEADKETYRLMIAAVGKDEGQWFSDNDLRNFPCDELLAIDRLWVKHSDGLYGFSVQKQIYEECGGMLDFTFPSNKTWNEFCDRVAWKDKGKYLTSYSDLFNKNFMRTFQQLEEYLKAKEWEKADQETYRLMLTAIGKEYGDWFSQDELRNFPCDELLAIDRLWVKHSNGLYGFSVQKQIYEECGGKLDFTFPTDDTWNKFCDRVAWKDKGRLTSYSDLFNKNFINNSGHLPCLGKLYSGVMGGVVYVSLMLGDVEVSFLASRLVNCSR